MREDAYSITQTRDPSDFPIREEILALIPISPITAENVSPYIGGQICAVMHDGTRHFGILRGIDGGQLYMDVASDGLALASLPDKKRKQAKGMKPEQAHTKAFGFGFGRGAFALSLALLAALFFIPWFFI